MANSNDEYEVGEIKYPTGFGLKDIAGWGSTGLVVLDKASGTVVKTAHDNDELVERERRVYERFTERGGHPNILRYYGTFERGIRLEHAPRYNISSLIQNPGDGDGKGEATPERRLRWAAQVADALGFVHDSSVIHGDVKLANVLLGAELDAKLTDFAGSSIDGSPLLVGVAQSHQYPGELVSTKADIFSLGCLIYELMTGTSPYEGRSDKDIKKWYSRGIFPDVKALGPVGSVIAECWQGKYATCREVVQDLKRCRESTLSPVSTIPI
ncbi:kinase-like domain-containing protein [Chaetomium tenue]|uniref:Kinase-like domain-containing protein n=1 Tax=Chaetomium tenue TaxID=1854479 RepID=A0ACB7PFL1_9PEZI|nr:kinase-like domain-containing protein [Chaetomium globosum]